jgi:hypothetical protein
MNNMPAFPSTLKDASGNIIAQNEGMTLRDYFACQALAWYWAESGHDVSFGDCQITANQCYCMADAMMVQRDKP